MRIPAYPLLQRLRLTLCATHPLLRLLQLALQRAHSLRGCRKLILPRSQRRPQLCCLRGSSLQLAHTLRKDTCDFYMMQAYAEGYM